MTLQGHVNNYVGIDISKKVLEIVRWALQGTHVEFVDKKLQYYVPLNLLREVLTKT